MAPRAYWKGYLKLSLVSCPIALFPATSEREKIGFHQLNKNTGHRIKYRKVDAGSGDEVESADIIKGYEVGKGAYIELDIPRSSKLSRSRASARSTSTSLCPRMRSTNCT
jgi:DNA end-binding protein Ku